MAMVAYDNLEIKQFNVVNAFLNAPLMGDPMYYKLPDGFKE